MAQGLPVTVIVIFHVEASPADPTSEWFLPGVYAQVNLESGAEWEHFLTDRTLMDGHCTALAVYVYPWFRFWK